MELFQYTSRELNSDLLTLMPITSSSIANAEIVETLSNVCSVKESQIYFYLMLCKEVMAISLLYGPDLSTFALLGYSLQNHFRLFVSDYESINFLAVYSQPELALRQWMTDA